MSDLWEQVEKIEWALDGMQYVRVIDGVAYVWNGGLTVNIYLLPDWENIDVFTLGDTPEGVDEVNESIEDHHNPIDDPRCEECGLSEEELNEIFLDEMCADCRELKGL